MHDGLTLTMLHRVLVNEQAEAKSRAAEAGRLEERVRAADEESELAPGAQVRGYEWTAQRASWAAGIEQPKAEHETLAAQNS